MSTPIVEVWLWDLHIASLAMSPAERVTFAYTPDFLATGYEVSPILMATSNRTFDGFDTRSDTFKGLPPLVIDSLPDAFGEGIINQWMARQGRSAPLTPLERLCHVGTRGMGGLEYRPATPRPEVSDGALDVALLVELANEALAPKQRLSTDGLSSADDFAQILSVGTSAGGARAKAVIAFDPTTHEVRSGQATGLPDGFEHWLVKFDGVDGNRDKELADPLGFGRVEYAYARMAQAADIDMMECRLLEENGRAHFMTRRFDRPGANEKLHFQSLCAMSGLDFNQARAHSYEQLFQTMRRIELGHDEEEEMIRRCIFNIVTRNQDDHTKNFGFLMDRASGDWHLSPAFDVTFAFNPTGAWTSQHQLTLGGKADGWTRAEIVDALTRATRVRPAAIDGVFDHVLATASRWPQFAADVGIDQERADGLGAAFRRFD